MAVVDIKSASSFDQLLRDAGRNLVVVHFWAAWAPQCQQMTDVMVELSKDAQLKNIQFVKVEAEEVPEVSQKYEIVAVPTCVLIKSKQVVDRVNGADAPELATKVKKVGSDTMGGSSSKDISAAPKEDINVRLKKLVNAADVMLFMKGTPKEPRCGFSKQIVQILKENNVTFSSFNILSDDEVRQSLKTYSEWPTYPQLYAKGELLGGLDIVKEMVESGELLTQLPGQQSLEDRLKALVNKDKVMLFMKGDPDAPRCGFSRTTIGILNETGVKYSHFDILEDEAVRQGLKKYSNWPTYPQLYVNGELVGGLDILKELKESGDLESTLKG